MDGLDPISDFLRQFWGLWLMLLFLAVVWWAFRPRNRERFREDAMIPFRDDEDNGVNGQGSDDDGRQA